jgi:hypothetical protein
MKSEECYTRHSIHLPKKKKKEKQMKQLYQSHRSYYCYFSATDFKQFKSNLKDIHPRRRLCTKLPKLPTFNLFETLRFKLTQSPNQPPNEKILKFVPYHS